MQNVGSLLPQRRGQTHMRTVSSAFILTGLMLLMVCAPFVQASGDGDGDGVLDLVDRCPYAFGNATSTDGVGCPDADGDGNADFETPTAEDWDESSEVARENDPVGDSADAIAWAPNGTLFVAGGSGGQVMTFDARGGLLATIDAGPQEVTSVAFRPDGAQLAIGGEEGRLLILNATDWSTIIDLGVEVGSLIDVESLHFASDSGTLYLGTSEPKLAAFDSNTWAERWNITFLPGTVFDIDSTPDGRLLAVGTHHQLHVVNTTDGSTVWTNTTRTANVEAVSISPDGRYVIAGGRDRFVTAYHSGNGTTIVTASTWTADVRDVEFAPDGGSFFVAYRNGRSISKWTTEPMQWNQNFGWYQVNNQNRGVHDIALDHTGTRLAVAQRHGDVSLRLAPSGFLAVTGDDVAVRLDDGLLSQWTGDERFVNVERSWFPSVNGTADLCNGRGVFTSTVLGADPASATPFANHSTSGMLDCVHTNRTLLQVPFGLTATALVTKADGPVAQCFATIGSLSLGQVRWVMSGLSDAALAAEGLDLASIAPNDDGDTAREWRDLHQGCVDQPIHLVHSWTNWSTMMIARQAALCADCPVEDPLFQEQPSLRYRYERAPLLGQGPDSGVLSIMNGATGGTLLGLMAVDAAFLTAPPSGLIALDLVDNRTHGSADARAAGAVAGSPSFSDIGTTYPLTADFQMMLDEADREVHTEFLKWILDPLNQIALESEGVLPLPVERLVNTWARLGENRTDLLPDEDDDGVWDGLDRCPQTIDGLMVDAEGCHPTQRDTDEDGFNDAIDSCVNITGTSTQGGSVGCFDGDGDGWADALDRFASDATQWNDTDGDGYGDNWADSSWNGSRPVGIGVFLENASNADRCPTVSGNSTLDRLGCLDRDGDGRSDPDVGWGLMDGADAFPDDPTQSVDSDGDGHGDDPNGTDPDLLPNDSTQWQDEDGDGFGDDATGRMPDACPSVAGTSTEGQRLGCPDADGDGWDDELDALPNESSQWSDLDGDGFGDNLTGVGADHPRCQSTPESERSLVDDEGCGPSERDTDQDGYKDHVDACLNTPEIMRLQVDSTGCAPGELDADSDGVPDDQDWAPNDPTQTLDSDSDGYGDNSTGTNGDACPNQSGTSTIDRTGCVDTDGDGRSDSGQGWGIDQGADAFPNEPTQWSDADGDGFGDNWEDPEWNATRQAGYGTFLPGAVTPDRCPNEAMDVFSSYATHQGCLVAFETDSDTGGVESNDDEVRAGPQPGLLAIPVILIIVLGALITILVRRTGGSRSANDFASDTTQSEAVDVAFDAPSVQQPVEWKIGTDDPPLQPESSEQAPSPVDSALVTTEDLPPGITHPRDAEGYVWHIGEDGSSWYQGQDGHWLRWDA